jgi:hypothetical protein
MIVSYFMGDYSVIFSNHCLTQVSESVSDVITVCCDTLRRYRTIHILSLYICSAYVILFNSDDNFKLVLRGFCSVILKLACFCVTVT